jgi:hypothetical protein
VTWRERHLRAVRELEEAAAEVVLKELAGVLDIVRGTFAATTAAAGDEVAANVGSADDLAVIQSQWAQAVDSTLLPWFGEVFQAGGLAAVEQIGELSGEQAIGVNFELMDEAAARHLAAARNRFMSVGDVAWGKARAELLEGFQQGDSIDDMRRRLTDVTDLSRAQAEMVARTEVISASNGGAMSRVRLLGDDAPPFKQWLSTLDGRTRPTHARADNQVVARDAKFQVGIASLDYPGDPGGPFDEVINCRCTVLFTEDPDPIGAEGRQVGGVTEQAAPLVDDLPDADAVADMPAPEVEAGPGPFSPTEFLTGQGGFSVKAAKAYQADAWGGWNADLNPQQRRVVQDYAGDNTFSHFAINAHLRGIPGRGGRPVPARQVERKIANMDAAFEHASAEVPTDVTVYRGFTGDFAARLVGLHREGRLVSEGGGARVRDRGFVSTSMDRRQANVFAREGAKGERVNMEYRLRAGQKGIAPSQTGSLGARFADELEVILPRGQTYEVLESEMGSNGVLNVVVEVVDG